MLRCWLLGLYKWVIVIQVIEAIMVVRAIFDRAVRHNEGDLDRVGY
jgi:hypothetical protein